MFDLSNGKKRVSNNRNRESGGKSDILRKEGFRSSVVEILNLRQLLDIKVSVFHRIRCLGQTSGLESLAFMWTRKL